MNTTSNVTKLILLFSLLIMPFLSRAQVGSASSESSFAKWFPEYDLTLGAFRSPSTQFGPFVRWWWPGNYVDSAELKREIDVLADHAFGGVEIQPLNLFIPGSPEVRARVTSWDGPDFYQHVAAVMEEARVRGLTVDMTDGSGWPPGGPFLSMEDNFITLEWAAIDTAGGHLLHLALPAISNNTGVKAHLETLLAARVRRGPSAENETTAYLDSSSVVVITPNVSHDSVQWNAPPGNWKIIAIWSRPSGERGMQAAPVSGPVMNHFDSTKVFKNYEHLFGARTGLEQYFGNPMRAVFNDSYEFVVDRHFSADFLRFFRQRRGYDITPWLPAEMRKGYNYVSYMRPAADPDFSFSAEDWRLRYDYDLTLSELLGLHFLQASKDWMEVRGLLHRTQAYGLPLDMIASAGLASIPETESMLGPEANLKIMTSGGHLYNRPIESAESVVFAGRAYTMTPQKIRIAVDKLFAAGVNQVIYHGVPYRYTPPELGPEGWYPFSTPMIPMVNFSANLGEGNIFWKFQKEVNEYVTRTQYALRAGKPHADVLIYFPFMDVDGLPDNPEEILAKGLLPGVEGPLPPNKEVRNIAKEQWAAQVYPVINALEAHGITWDWVNDASIREFGLTTDKQIEVRGNHYQALILANDSIIEMATAKKIAELTKQGMKLLATGALATRQPSYLNWKINDERTGRYIQEAMQSATAYYCKDAQEAIGWIQKLRTPVRFAGAYSFSRQAERDMSDGSRVQFIWNKSNHWQTISLQLDNRYLSSFWLNAVDGSIQRNDGKRISCRLAPYSSILLYASTRAVSGQRDGRAGKAAPSDSTKAILTIQNWKLKADSVEVSDNALFDWRSHNKLKYSGATGIYTADFQWTREKGSSRIYLDLGQVYFTAEVLINGRRTGALLFSPYIVDITDLITQGANTIEIRVTPSALNSYIGKADAGDSRYKQFKNKDDQLMAAGLVGPVLIRSDQP
jgi:hypothetical protein